MKDTDRFKDSLLSYLAVKGIDVSTNPISCFNPDHPDKNPSMLIYQDHFSCKGSCGIHGDVYDAAGILCNIEGFNERFEEVERALTGVITDDYKPMNPPAITLNDNSLQAITTYTKNHTARGKAVMGFLKQRGYKEELAKDLVKYYGYWPGYGQAKQHFDEFVLETAGFTEKAHYHAGVIFYLAKGFKLMWYETDRNGAKKCEKRNTKSSKVFPSPLSEEELTDKIIITEAETSASSMEASGFGRVISSGSVNGITKNNVHLLKKVNTAILLYDGDNAGYFHSGLEKVLYDKKTGNPIQRAIAKAKFILQSGFKGQLYAGRLPEGKDPDDLIREGKGEQLQKIIDDAVEIKLSDFKKKENEGKKPESKKPPFQFLGYDSKSHYVIPGNQSIIIKIGRGENSLKNLMNEIAPRKWWIDSFHRMKERDGVETPEFQRTLAFEWFREQSYKKGIFDDKRIRGCGVYLDNGKYMINTGDFLKTIDGKKIDFENWKGENTYIKTRRKIDISGKKWETKESRFLWDQINTFGYEKKIDPIAVLGYATISPFSGALERRPSLWITAAPSTGKSKLMTSIIIPAVGDDRFSLVSGGVTSEPYIRQSLGNDAIPTLIDEFESDSVKEKMIIKSIVRLNRSTYGGYTGGKGGADNKPIDFKLYTMFCFASINVLLSEQADEQRIHICRLKKRRGTCKPIEDFSGLRARMFSRLPKVMSDITECKSKLLEIGCSDRIADTYSPFFAGAWNALYDAPYLEGDEEDSIISQFMAAMFELTDIEQESDDDRVIKRLLQSKIKVSVQEELSIAEMLTKKQSDEGAPNDVNWMNAKANNDIIYGDRIQRYGMKRYTNKEGHELLAIAVNHVEIQRILIDTSFGNYEEILRRNKTVTEKSKKVWIARATTTAIVFDWFEFYEKYLKEVDEDIEQPF